MTRRYPFAQVDVFADEPLRGNPVAVVLDSLDLPTATMQRFTDWTNLSEATFVGPPTNPDADYAVRIFTSTQELPFTGHPTLGTCHAWLAAGGRPAGELIVQECGAGLVSIRRDEASGALAFAAPPRRRSGPLDDDALDTIAAGLGIASADIVAHQWCDNGPPWQAVLLESAEQVLALKPDARTLDGLFVGVVGAHPAGADVDLEVRGFFPTTRGLGEDPVTGSLNAALGQWLTEAGHVAGRYRAAQGTALGRAGRVTVERAGADVWVGGRSVTVVEGSAQF